MKGWVSVSGIAGLLLLLAGGLALLIMQKMAVWSGVLLGGGILLLAAYGWERRRGARTPMGGRRVRLGASAAASVLLMLVILSVVNALAARHGKTLDLTAGGQFSLSPQTQKILKGLDRDVEAICFYKETTGGRRALEDLLEQYRHHGRRFQYRFVDPDRHPGEAKTYKITNYGTTVLVSGDRQERVFGAEERDVTNALIKVSREGKKKFYFLTGHGEHGLDDTQKSGLSFLRQGLERENFDAAELLLARTDSLPADCAALVVAGPTSDLFAPEIASIGKYLDGGGKALVLLDPDSLPALEAYLQSWGIKLKNDVIVDRMSRLFGGDYLMPIVSQYESHDITRDFNVISFFPMARSVDTATPLPEGVQGQRLALTGPDAWGEVDRQRLREGYAGFTEGQDTKGPIPVAVVMSKNAAIAKGTSPETPGEGEGKEAGAGEAPTPQSRLVVFGDSDFITNANVTVSGNAALIMNTLSWLAEEEDLVAIRPKDVKNAPLLLSAAQGRLIFFLPVVGMPLAVLVTGLVVVLRRRWHR